MILDPTGVPIGRSNSSEIFVDVIPTPIVPINDEHSGWQNLDDIVHTTTKPKPYNEAETLRRWTNDVKVLSSIALDNTVERPKLALAS